ncbi:MAG: ATP-binding protein [bacterium]|nr:ATP-binding protein [bacterium]
MKRTALKFLSEWTRSSIRKPILLRGARQVGKTHLVRQLAKLEFEQLVEINFEKNPDFASFFDDLSPDELIPLLETRTRQQIVPGKTLLFLDEIQMCPRAIMSLRYFCEDRPDLHVVAAGSLLDFVLAEEGFSVPVGRIQYLQLGPLNFCEFLDAMGEDRLVAQINQFDPKSSKLDPLHDYIMTWLRRFIVIGGMPEAVKSYRDTQSFNNVDQIKEAILTTYRDDFGKYRGKLDQELIRNVFNGITGLIGEKVKYTKLDRNARAAKVSEALNLLCRAGVVTKIHHSSANGLPLGAQINTKIFKPLFLDVGLMLRTLGLDLAHFSESQSLMTINNGAIAEQLVGQELLAAQPMWQDRSLVYWVREQKSSSAEVDYVISVGTNIYPIEVKAGTTGHLRSLHRFLYEKKLDWGVRLGTGKPKISEINHQLSSSEVVTGTVLSLPLYLAGQVPRIMKKS